LPKKPIARPFLLALLLFAIRPGIAVSQGVQGAPASPKAPIAPVSVVAVEIRPASPGPDSLCQLRVKVRNGGTRKASSLVFAVRIDGQPLAVYKRQVYLQVIDPGATAEVRLFNFWTTETGRPLPKDGQLRVEVALAEARWVEVKSEGGAEVVTPLGTIEGLAGASPASLTVPLKGAAAKPAPP
jgi:hypothetical protein